jgi:integrase
MQALPGFEHIAFPPTTHVSADAIYRPAALRIVDRLDPSDALEGLVASAPAALAPSSKRFYRAVRLVATDILVDRGQIEPERREEARARVKEAIDRVPLPGAPQTSALKTVAITSMQWRAVLARLERLSRREGDRPLARFTWLYVRLAPVFGFRPCEVWGLMRIDATTLRLPTAKSGNGRGAGSERFLDVAAIGADMQAMTDALIEVMAGMRSAGRDPTRIMRAMSERLARASRRVLDIVVCPYTLRHLAIAIWREAGYDEPRIAALVGHGSTRTAGIWYSRTGRKWRWGADPELVLPACPSPSPDPATATAAVASAVSGADSIAPTAPADPVACAPPADPRRVGAQARADEEAGGGQEVCAAQEVWAGREVCEGQENCAGQRLRAGQVLRAGYEPRKGAVSAAGPAPTPASGRPLGAGVRPDAGVASDVRSDIRFHLRPGLSTDCRTDLLPDFADDPDGDLEPDPESGMGCGM